MSDALIALAVALLLIALPLWRHRGYRRLRNLPYSDAAPERPLRADVYLPNCAGGARPAVLVVHGGAWCSGERWQVTGLAQRLARAGFVAVSVNYRLAPRHLFPAQLDDLQLALRWLHENAARFGVDRRRIGAWGYSAGAHLVAMLGVQAADAVDAALRPRAIVAGGTPADLRLYRGGTLVPQFLGARLQDDPERFRRASPAALVHAATPPMFLYHGARDRLVPPPHPRALQQALQAAGVPHELVWLAGRGHAGAYLFDGAAGRAAVDFLRRHLAPT